MMAIFGVDFTEGDETYDPEDINAMKGTFWYDPIAFMREMGAASALLSLNPPTQ